MTLSKEQIENLLADWTRWKSYPAGEINELCKEVLALRAENERLRAVLSQIALYTDKPECFEVADMAIAALDGQ